MAITVIVAVFVLLPTAPAIVVAIENYRGRHAWEQFVRESRADGENLDPASVIPREIPDSENFAAVPLFQPLFDYTRSQDSIWQAPQTEASVLITSAFSTKTEPTFGRTWAARPIDLQAWANYFQKDAAIRSSSTAGPAAIVLDALQKYDGAYSKLLAAGQRPRSRFPVHYDEGVAALYPHLRMLPGFGKIARLRAAAELSLRRPDSALDDIQAGFRLSESLENEPTMVSALVRISLFSQAFASTWEGLAAHQWNEDHLLAIERHCARINFCTHFHLVIRGERNIVSLPTIEHLRTDPDAFFTLGSVKRPSEAVKSLYRCLPTGWFDQNKVFAGRSCAALIACCDPKTRRFFPDRVAKLNLNENLKSAPLPYVLLCYILLPVVDIAPQDFATAQGTVNLTRTAIALERHRLRHGAYPENLADLDRDLLPDGIPIDPAAGTPPHYTRADSNHFTLYYDGWNCIDDGGHSAWKDPAKQNPDFTRGDWVWPEAQQLGSQG